MDGRGASVTVDILPLGDAALIVRFGDVISRACSARVDAAARRIAELKLAGVTDVVPAYTTLALHFDPAATSYHELAGELAGAVDGAGKTMHREPRVIEIAVRYEGEDLSEVAERTGLTLAEVIQHHSAPEYHVYMLGFVPGFAYLGDLDPALVLGRRSNPRQRVPAGSVAIAGAQTAVYPLATPGGWHIIGSTRLVMFDPARDPPALLRAGDTVRFRPVAT